MLLTLCTGAFLYIQWPSAGAEQDSTPLNYIPKEKHESADSNYMQKHSRLCGYCTVENTLFFKIKIFLIFWNIQNQKSDQLLPCT